MGTRDDGVPFPAVEARVHIDGEVLREISPARVHKPLAGGTETGNGCQMRVVIDALGATRFSGGMMLHAMEIIRTWREEFPADRMTVVGGRALQQKLVSVPDIKFIVWNNEHVAGRSVGQLFVSPLIGLLQRADRVISLSPIVSPLVPKSRSICFQHDWRHIRRPEEFSTSQKLYRKLWVLSARTAGLNACISSKAEYETHQIAPGAKTKIVPNGWDHARRWDFDDSFLSGIGPNYVVTYGHHNNKRPELVIDAWKGVPKEFNLVVLGARGEYLKYLEKYASVAGVHDRVIFPGFVSDDEYHSLVKWASCIVLASSDEGFGLPIAEAEYFAIPAVVTEDIGVLNIFPRAVVAKVEPADIGKAINTAITKGQESRKEVEFVSWVDTVKKLRYVNI
ncbi:glycosyltransferase family 4 protein [Pseudoclavibacter caeni]|uniref:Glycosyltransferase family 4 protein n=1 Tax=Pseudoclavibacter caeni TaxID=908846 RepID=A0A7C8FXH9_9MICO|nr:glycosyltransferase family 4 protein [Pseudoclavibacter caeni]